jgi:hypothetical protein
MIDHCTPREAVPCELCAFEVFLLEQKSDFLPENIEMYEDYYGIGGRESHSWIELAREYGYTPNTAALIAEDIHAWLDENSPYRNRKMNSDIDPHHVLCRQCPCKECRA